MGTRRLASLSRTRGSASRHLTRRCRDSYCGRALLPSLSCRPRSEWRIQQMGDQEVGATSSRCSHEVYARACACHVRVCACSLADTCRILRAVFHTDVMRKPNACARVRLAQDLAGEALTVVPLHVQSCVARVTRESRGDLRRNLCTYID